MDYQVDIERLEQAEAQEEMEKENGTFNKGEGKTQKVPVDENGEEIELPF